MFFRNVQHIYGVLWQVVWRAVASQQEGCWIESLPDSFLGSLHVPLTDQKHAG